MTKSTLVPSLALVLIASVCYGDFPSTSHWDSDSEAGWTCIDRTPTGFPGPHHGVVKGTSTPDPDNALFIFFPTGWAFGGEPAHCWNTYPSPQSEVWFQFWFKWSDGYDFNDIRNKMFYQWIGPDSTNNHFIYTSGGGGHVGFEMQGAESGTWQSNTGYDPFIGSGVWYKGKAHFVINTPGVGDGVFQLWIDDGLVIDKSDVRYRGAGEESKGFYEMSITPVYGGMGGGDVSQDQYFYVDHTILSAIDPGSGPTPVCGDEQCTGGETCSSCPADCGSCTGVPGTVTDLAATALNATSISLSFVEVDDGTGQPAKYDIRFSAAPISWGAAASVAQGTCATPVSGTEVGRTRICTATGLAPATDYDFQLVAYRGTLNVDAVFGGLSNVASAATIAAGADGGAQADGGTGPLLDSGTGGQVDAGAGPADAGSGDAAGAAGGGGCGCRAADASPAPGGLLLLALLALLHRTRWPRMWAGRSPRISARRAGPRVSGRTAMTNQVVVAHEGRGGGSWRANSGAARSASRKTSTRTI